MTTRVVNLRHERADVRIARPSRWGNPFRIDGEHAAWLALMLGERADKAGRRAAAIKAYRAWMTDELLALPASAESGSELEFSDGRRVNLADVPAAMGAFMLMPLPPLVLPERPSLEPLRGKVLGCYCKPLACHGDVIVELLEGGT